MKNKRKRPSKKQHHNSFKSFWIIALFAILPLIYGIYLCTPDIQAVFFQATKVSRPNVARPNYSHDENLKVPVSQFPLTEQIIHHKGYTVSYNKDKKNPFISAMYVRNIPNLTVGNGKHWRTRSANGL